MKKQEYDYEYLSRLSDEELTGRFNRLVGNTGWGNARAAFGAALRAEFLRRNLDCSIIIGEQTMKVSRRVKVDNGRLVFRDEMPDAQENA